MGSGDRLVIERRLERLGELVALLRRDRAVVARIATDADVRDRVERRLQLAAQAAIDVAHFIIARARWVRSERETLWEVLGREGVLSATLATSLRGLTGFRNVLVHEYLGIDLDVVTEAVEVGIEDLERFRAEVLDHLAREAEG